MLANSLSTGFKLGQASAYSTSLLGTEILGDMFHAHTRFLQDCTFALAQDGKHTSDSLADMVAKAMMRYKHI